MEGSQNSLRDDPEALEEALAELLLEAEEARGDSAKFFEFVLRDEVRNEPIRCAEHQKLMLQFSRAHDRWVELIPVGHGKCHGAGTRILLSDGSIKNVEDVQVGDRLMGPSGPRLVLSLATGEDEMFRVTPVKGGESFTANAAHLLTLVRSDGRVSEYELRDYQRSSRWFKAEHFMFRVPVDAFEGETPVDVDPYFLGVWFGDGNHSLRQGVVITNVDPEVIAACRSTADTFGLALVHHKQANGQSFRLSNPRGKGGGRANPLVTKMRQLFWPRLSMKRLRTAPREQRLQFLAGFLDADAHLQDKCFYVSQKRRDWARDVAFIARSLGLSVATSERRGSGRYRDRAYTTLCIYGHTDRIPTRIPRKRAGARLQKKNAARTHFTVEPLGRGRYYGFTLDGDGRYLLGDFTVTHNTYNSAGMLLQDLGDDPLQRCSIVSAAQAQAEKPLALVRQYIENSPELRMVYPNLQRSRRGGEPWTTTDITVDRPPGIRDPSLIARGLDSKQILGSRWRRLIIDDLMNEENTRTPEQRDKAWAFVQKTLRTRVDPVGGSIGYICTAWHQDDTTQRLIRPRALGGSGWPALIMRADGIVQIQNTDFDSDLIAPIDDRPAGDPLAQYRLVNLPEGSTLWPERWSAEALQAEREELHPAVYNQIYLNICRDDSTALCRQEYVDRALALGAKMGFKTLIPALPDGFPHLVFAGVDLAFSKADAADESAIFVFAVYPDGSQSGPPQIRVPLWIESGRWGTDELYQRLVRVNNDFRPAGIAVESNAAQEGVRQLMATADKSLVLKPHRTDATKNSIVLGLPSIFAEMANGAWAFPNDAGRMHPMIRKFIDQCLYYTPADHAGDILMACYFARDLAKKYGALTRKAAAGVKDNRIASVLLAR